MPTRALLLLALALALAPFNARAEAKAPGKKFEALCLAFTWSEDGRKESAILLEGTKITFALGERKEILRTPYAIYQAVVSENIPDRVFLDVLTLDGVRIAGANDQVTVGPANGEPGVHTHYQCQKWEKPARGKAGK